MSAEPSTLAPLAEKGLWGLVGTAIGAVIYKTLDFMFASKLDKLDDLSQFRKDLITDRQNDHKRISDLEQRCNDLERSINDERDKFSKMASEYHHLLRDYSALLDKHDEMEKELERLKVRFGVAEDREAARNP